MSACGYTGVPARVTYGACGLFIARYSVFWALMLSICWEAQSVTSSASICRSAAESATRATSSAYSRQLILVPSSRGIPASMCISYLASLSGIKLKRTGEEQAPCLTPFSIGK